MLLIAFCILCLLHSCTDSSNWETPNSRREFRFTFVMIDSTDIFRHGNRGGKRRNRDRMAAYNSSKSSQSSASLRWESDCASEYSSGGSTVSELCCHRSHTEGTEDGEQTENERLRYKVRILQLPLCVHRCGHR